MKKQNTSREMFEKKSLRIENLESKQLLSAVGFEAASDAPAEVAAADLNVSDSVILEAPAADVVAEVAPDAVADVNPYYYSVVGNAATINFNLDAKTSYTLEIVNTNNPTNVTYKSFKTNAEGEAKVSLTLKNGETAIGVYEGSQAQVKKGEADLVSEFTIAGVTTVAPKMTALKSYYNDEAGEMANGATEDSVTFLVKTGTAQTIGDYLDNAPEQIRLYGKLNGAKTATEYAVEDNGDGTYSLKKVGATEVEDYTVQCFGISEDTAGTKVALQIQGLDAAKSQSVSIYFKDVTDGNSIATKASNVVTASTTKVAYADPATVAAARTVGAESSSIDVTFEGVKGATYTITYSYEQGDKVITKTANAKVKVDANNNGSYTIKNLKAGTEYTISVSANADARHAASDKVEANDGDSVTTAQTLIAPQVKQIDKTDDSVTVQLVNWEKLYEVADTVTFTVEDTTFTYDLMNDFNIDEKGRYVCVIDNLNASQTYTVKVTGSVSDEDGNIIAISKPTNVKVSTAVAQYPAITAVDTEVINTGSLKKCNVQFTIQDIPTVDYKGETKEATSYSLKYWVTEEGEATAKTVTMSKAEYTLKNLAVDTAYTFRVCAKANTFGTKSDWSDEFTFDTTL